MMKYFFTTVFMFFSVFFTQSSQGYSLDHRFLASLYENDIQEVEHLAPVVSFPSLVECVQSEKLDWKFWNNYLLQYGFESGQLTEFIEELIYAAKSMEDEQS